MPGEVPESPLEQIVRAVGRVTGIPLDDIDGYVLVFSAADGSTGVLTSSTDGLTAIEMLASGISGIAESRTPDHRIGTTPN